MEKINVTQRAWRVFLFVLLTALGTQVLNAQTITTNTQSTHDGFFYSFWNDNQSGSASMTLGPAGNYSTTWNNVHNFTAGKGWRTGRADRTVCFEGTYNGGSNGFLAVYGWTKDPLIEYYVVETHGQWTPPGNTGGVQFKGEYTCDGSVYRVYTARRTNAPSIIGNADFDQYWSVRTNKRSTGTVPFSDHVAAWASFGMPMGATWDYQIMESEGYTSSGNSNITVWECDGPGSSVDVEITAPTATTPFIAPATVEISANASTEEGYITKVEFFNGDTKLGEDSNAPYTYTWNNVARGSYQITAVATDNNGTSGTSAAVNVRVNIPQAPYGGSPHQIPGVIEFEDFDEGGNNSAYYDDSPGTEVSPAPNYRTDEDVDIENCTDDGGGYNLGWTTVDEWLEYTVNVQDAGSYDIEVRFACESTGRTITLSSDGNNIASNVQIPSTGDWQTWESLLIEDIQLNAGEQVIRLTIGGTDYVNLNKMTFIPHNIPVPPVVDISLPDGITEFHSNSSVAISVSATSEQSSISNVQLFVDNQLVDTDNSSPYSFTWTSSEIGNHTLRVVATDANGDETEESVTISIIEAPILDTYALKAGWNLVGCPLETQNIEDALSDIWSEVLIVKNESGFYDTSINPSLNSLTQLEWGRGYFIKVSNDCEISW